MTYDLIQENYNINEKMTIEERKFMEGKATNVHFIKKHAFNEIKQIVEGRQAYERLSSEQRRKLIR